MLQSRLVRQSDFIEPWFQDAAAKLKHPIIYHRKLWEWCYIYQGLLERHMLLPGKKGLVFGVGKEPLVSAFASHGCHVTATDLDLQEAASQGWVSTNQHSQQALDLCDPQICDIDTFKNLVTFEYMDMNKIPAHFHGQYDFTWSSCSFEHCGSIELGQQFLVNQMKCLRPGGVAIHTTEYNLSSNDATLESGVTVLFRKRDIERMVELLRADGHIIDVNYTAGTGIIESHIDVPPYNHHYHLRLQIAQYVSTSIGLIIQKK